MKKTLFVVCVFLLTLGFAHSAIAEANNLIGRYTYKTYREGKGGFVNYLELIHADVSVETSQTTKAPPVATPKANGLEVCPDPNAPCNSARRKFAAYEMPFRLPARLRAGRQYKSIPFYAVIVKTYDEEPCDSDDHTASIERERLRIQKTYSARKVFGSYSCPNLDTVDYDYPGKHDQSGERVLIMTFIAVYAGKSSTEAEEFLLSVRKQFPDAVLKEMTASYEIMDQ